MAENDDAIGQEVAALSDSQVDSEIRSAELQMMDRRQWWSPHNQDVRERRLPALYATREARRSGGAPAPTGAHDDISFVQPDAAAVEAAGWDLRTYRAGTNAMADVLTSVSAAERRDLSASFGHLGDSVAAACIQELSQPAPWSPPVSQADLARFGSTREGKELLALWRHDAGTNLARLRGRMERLLGSLDEHDGNRVLAWFNGLSSSQARAVMARLAG